MADFTSFNPPAIQNSSEILHNNILVFGYSGSGVSSSINTLATSIQPSRTTSLVRALSRTSTPSYPSKTRLTINFIKHPLNYYNPQLKINIWESWGISSSADGNNYDSIELDIILQGMLPEKTLMPRDAKAVSTLLAQAKKPYHINAIHAVAFCIPQDVLLNLQTDDLARIKNALKQVRERGREPALIVTKLDQAGATVNDCFDDSKSVQEARELAAGIFGFPLEDVFSLINYNSKSLEKIAKRVPEVDNQASRIMKALLTKCQDFQNRDPSTIAFIKGKNAATVIQKAGSLASLTPENAAQKIAEQQKHVEQEKKAKEIEESLQSTSGVNFNFMQSQMEDTAGQKSGEEVKAVEVTNKPVKEANVLPSATPSSASTMYSATSAISSPNPALSLVESSPSPADSTISSNKTTTANNNSNTKAENTNEKRDMPKEPAEVKVVNTTTVVNKVDEVTIGKVKTLESQTAQMQLELKELKTLSKTIQSVQAEMDKISMSNSLSQQEILSMQSDLRQLSKFQQEQAISNQQHSVVAPVVVEKENDGKGELEESIQRHQEELDQLRNQYTQIDAKYSGLNTQLQSTIEELKKKIEKKSDNATALKQQIESSIEELVEPIKADVLRLNMKINEIIVSSSSQPSKNEKTSEAPVSPPAQKDYKKEIFELQKNVDMATAKLESFERNNEVLATQVKELQKELASFKENNHPLAQPAQGKSETNPELLDEIRELKKKIEKTQEQVTNAEAESKKATAAAEKAEKLASKCHCVIV